ncbi:MAG: Fpg/Nei family DNA glycosylase, partial [Gammaproteobacteria bacterium]|nr:Fpg/Nei family DNA glycosylase [Gammaproteobacteria bacterium]
GHARVPIGEALLNQQLVAGIGNVYKSELMFLNQLNPFVALGELSDAQLVHVLEDARRLMQRNLEGTPRKVRFATRGGRVWVYNRRELPCYTCGDKVKMRRQGDAGRSTYYCARCQDVPVAARSA